MNKKNYLTYLKIRKSHKIKAYSGEIQLIVYSYSRLQKDIADALGRLDTIKTNILNRTNTSFLKE